MKAVGIIAEFNPFHMGHRFIIEKAKELSGYDKAVVVMSGSFVQRGEPACADKFKRAEWAITNGADMVIELPDVFALSCAERFASAGIRILKGIGMVDSICFGSESGDLEALKESALSDQDLSLFEEEMKKGVSYPRAVSSASNTALASNDILGAEYIRASEKYSCGFRYYAVKRESGYLDDSLKGVFSSALAIRRAMEGTVDTETEALLEKALPVNVFTDMIEMKKEGLFPASLKNLSDLILYRFRSMTASEISELPEISEGLENLFAKYASESDTAEELLNKVKSKRYTMARLKRATMCALLGITRKLQDRAAEDDAALYARVLAVREGSGEMLEQLTRSSTIPVITRSKESFSLPDSASEVLKISELAHSIMALGRSYGKACIPDLSHRMIVR